MLRNLKNLWRPAGPAKPIRFQPRLLRFEDRTVPTTFTVVSIADSGVGSLRAAVSAAVDGDAIVFAKSTQNKSIVLSSGELSITQDITITGPGANKLTISGGDTQRIFAIAEAASVSMSGLRLIDGRADAGGAIVNDGELSLNQVTLLNNDSVGDFGGGAIHNQEGATVTITNSTLNNNTATAGFESSVFGGGLLNEGTAKLVACTLTGNAALGGNLPTYGYSGGGAICNYAGDLTVVSCNLTGNKAVAAAGENLGAGGAIFSNGGPAYDMPSTVVISQSAISGNLASGGNKTTNNGGGISNIGFMTTMTIQNSTITGNRCIGGDNGDGYATLSQGIGGGIANGIGSTLNLTNSRVSGNEAVGGNNATITAANPQTGGGLGGGISNLIYGVLNLSNCVISNNLSRGGSTSIGPGANAIGGGINNFAFSTMTMTQCVVAYNVVAAGAGGPGAGAAPTGLGSGGGIDIQFLSNATIDNSSILFNTAFGGAGGSGNDGGDGTGGAIAVGNNAKMNTAFDEDSSLTLSNSIVAGNRAFGGMGGVGGDGGNGLGGGLYVFSRPDTAASIELVNSRVYLNAAFGGHFGTGGAYGHGIGGGIHNDGGNLNVDALSDVRFNVATTSHNNIFESP